MAVRRKCTRKRAARRKSTAKPKPQKREPEPLTRAELARWLNISEKTLSNWRIRGMPQIGTGKAPLYSLSEVVEWRLERERAAQRTDPNAIDVEDLKKRKLLADTELAELQLEEARRLVVPVDIVIDRLGESMSAIAARIRAFPGRYAAAFAAIRTAPKMKKALRDACDELLDELADPDGIAREAGDEGASSPRIRPKPRRGGPPATP